MTLFKNCSWNFNPSKNMAAKFWSVNNYASGECGLLALYRHVEILKKSSLKPLLRFWNSFAGLFLSWPFSKFVCKNFDPSIIMALVNGGFLHYTDMKKFLKNLVRNCWSDFEIISQKCSLTDLSQKLFGKFWSVNKNGSGEWVLLHYTDINKFLNESSHMKPLVRFWNNFMEMFLAWPFSNIVYEILICPLTWQ